MLRPRDLIGLYKGCRLYFRIYANLPLKVSPKENQEYFKYLQLPSTNWQRFTLKMFEAEAPAYVSKKINTLLQKHRRLVRLNNVTWSMTSEASFGTSLLLYLIQWFKRNGVIGEVYAVFWWWFCVCDIIRHGAKKRGRSPYPYVKTSSSEILFPGLKCT